MIVDVARTLGGVGVFLVGMAILTEGLRALSGDRFRRFLAARTQTPWRGALAGATATAAVQSSSATTVTAVGFVGAGLLTFEQALGVIFGANIGTTATGWIVALVGFKLQLAALALPLLFVGAVLRLLGRGPARALGWSLAGFALLFVGIALMQDGMAAFQGAVTPESFPGGSILGLLQLVGIGVAITIVTQSSSAGVATAMVALGAGAIDFTQAAAMVIGMDVGTTFTAALATVGGSTAMRRTGWAHVIYNLMTGAMALILLGPYTAVTESWFSMASAEQAGDAQMRLVAFHTLFNLLGVVAVLPVARPFARLMMRLAPERGPVLTDGLDDRLLRDPPAAIDAALGALRAIVDFEMETLRQALVAPKPEAALESRLSVMDRALDDASAYVDRIKTEPADRTAHARHLALLHALDHAHRLAHRFSQTERLDTLRTDGRLRRMARLLARAAEGMRPRAEQNPPPALDLDRLRGVFRRQRRRFRARAVSDAATDRVDLEDSLDRMDAVRWLHRVVYHLWRLDRHLSRAVEIDRVTGSTAEAQTPARREAALSVREDL